MHKSALVALLIAAAALGTAPVYAQSASASAGGDISASAGLGGADVSASAGASASAGSDLSASSGEASAASSGGGSCTDIQNGNVTTSAIDTAALAAVTTVTVFGVDDCTGLGNLTALDSGAQAALAANPDVTAALQQQGYSGAEVIGYAVDGSTLVVYVKKS